MNDFFNDDGNPGNKAPLASAAIRTLFAAVETGFDKLAALTGNGSKIVAINAGATAQEALSTTGTGNVVRATSPTLVTPVLGTPTSGTLTNCTGLVPATGLSAVTGTGSAVLATSPTLVTPALGTPTTLVGTNITGTAAGLTAGSANAIADGIDHGTPSALVGTNITGTAAGLTAGAATTSSLPQNSQSTAYTCVIGDANKHILHPTADNNARVFTIPANASVAYDVGTTLTFVNEINTVTISITSDTLMWSPSGLTGSRTLSVNGMATALKITSTKWIISGAGLS